MSDFNFENGFNFEFEDHEDALWDESDWNGYLKQAELSIALFVKTYAQKSEEGEALSLDEVAFHLGWDKEYEWMGKEEEIDSLGESILEDLEWEHEEPEDEGTYTFHRHPVYLSTKGIIYYLGFLWTWFLKQTDRSISAMASWDFGQTLRECEQEVLQGIAALDTGEISLAICHFKRGLSALQSMGKTIQKIGAIPKHRPAELFEAEAKRALFDLREIFLRTIRSVRFQGN